MTIYLKQSTAVNVPIGQLLSSTDGTTLITAPVLDSEIFLYKHGGTTVNAKNDTGDSIDMGQGVHYTPLSQTDTNTVGTLILYAKPSGVLATRQEFCVLPANVYDSLIGGGAVDILDVSVVQWNGTAIHTVVTAGVPVVDVHTIPADAIDAASVKADAVTKIQNGLATPTNITAGTITTVGTVTTVTGGATAAELAKVPKSDAAVTWNATALASIQTECNDALIANNLDHLCLTATGAADMTTEVADNTILSRILGNGDTSTFVPSTDGLHASGVDIDAILADTGELQVDWVDGGRLDLLLDAVPTVTEFEARSIPSADYVVVGDTIAGVTTVATTTNLTNLPAVTNDWLTAAGVKADAVTKIQAGLATPTNITAGTITTVTNLTNAPTVGDFTAAMKASITAAVPTAIAIVDSVWDEVLHTDHEVASSASVLLQAASAPTAAAVADAVWDEVLHTDHEVASSASVLLQAAGAAGDPWATAIPGAYGAGTAGLLLGTTIPADISSILTDTGTTLDALIKRSLGSGGQENFRITSTTYSLTGKMTACVWKIYPTLADTNADTNAIATYTMAATYDGDDNLATYKVVTS